MPPSLDCSSIVTIIGVAVGSGWQVMVGNINLACVYVVGLPIGIFLGFNQHLGVKVIMFLLWELFLYFNVKGCLYLDNLQCNKLPNCLYF